MPTPHDVPELTPAERWAKSFRDAGYPPPRRAVKRTSPTVQDGVRPCPYCAEPIQAAAKKCKHCGEFLSTLASGTAVDRNRSSSRQHSRVSQMPINGVAALLSFIFPGAGQMIQGAILRGLLIAFGATIAYLLTFLVNGLFGLIAVGLHLWNVFDAVTLDN